MKQKGKVTYSPIGVKIMMMGLAVRGEGRRKWSENRKKGTKSYDREKDEENGCLGASLPRHC